MQTFSISKHIEVVSPLQQSGAVRSDTKHLLAQIAGIPTWQQCIKFGNRIDLVKDNIQSGPEYYLLITISQTTELLLSSSVPAVKPDFPTVCEEVQWVNLHTNGCC